MIKTKMYEQLFETLMENKKATVSDDYKHNSFLALFYEKRRNGMGTGYKVLFNSMAREIALVKTDRERLTGSITMEQVHSGEYLKMGQAAKILGRSLPSMRGAVAAGQIEYDRTTNGLIVFRHDVVMGKIGRKDTVSSRKGIMAVLTCDDQFKLSTAQLRGFCHASELNPEHINIYRSPRNFYGAINEIRRLGLDGSLQSLVLCRYTASVLGDEWLKHERQCATEAGYLLLRINVDDGSIGL